MASKSLSCLSPLIVLGAVFVFGAIMVALACVLDTDTALILFSEEGFFERMSPVIWSLAGFYLLWKWRDHTARYLILALTFFAFAGREHHIHKAFTSDSFLKINFYKQEFGLEQIFGGMAALFIIGLIVATFVILVRDVVIARGFKNITGQLLIAGFTVLFLSKVMDRAPAVLRKDYDIVLDAQFDLILQALEEGFEFFGPVLVLIAFVLKFNSANRSITASSSA